MFDILAILAIFVIGVVGGWLPTRIAMTPRGEWLLKMGNIFSGGVFLGGGLMHLMPEAAEMFEEVTDGAEFPYAFLLVAAGFALVLFIEKVLLQGEDVGRLSREFSTRDLQKIVEEIDARQAAKDAGEEYVPPEDHGHAMPESEALTGAQRAVPFMLTLVLSAHSLIAGATLGLEEEIAAGLALLIAILAHKGFAAFALGVSLKEAKFGTQYLMSVIVFFSLMTPIGVVLGLIFSSALEGDTAAWVQAIFNALAAGTFLYVAVLEIIGEAFEKRGHNRQQFVFMVLGFALMALLALAE